MTRRTRLEVALLEDRVTPVIGGYDVPFVSDTDDAFGTGNLLGVANYGNDFAAALVDRGAAVVGSRHLLIGTNSLPAVGSNITFNMRLPDGNIQVIQVPILAVTQNAPANNLAVVTLAAVAPFGASDYPIYTSAEAAAVTEVGKPYIIAGFGTTGTGTTGQGALDIQRMTITATGGQFRLVNGATLAQSSPLAFNPTPAQVQAALTQIGLGTVASPAIVTQPTVGPFVGTYEIRFTTPASNARRLQFVSDPAAPLVNGPDPGTVAFRTLSNGTFDVEFQRLTLAATGGTFRLGFGAAFTNPLPFNATAAQIQTALEAVPGVTEATVRQVTSGPNAGSFEIAFDTSAVDIPQLTVDATALTGTAAMNTIMDGGRSVLRLGQNEYDAAVAPDVLRSDFDNDGTDDFGTTNSIGFMNTGGGRFAITSVNPAPAATVFGSTQNGVRVSQYTTFITGVTEAPGYTLNLDMKYQQAGANGRPDTFRVVRNAGRIEVYVTDAGSPEQLYYADAAANIASIILTGSSDDDTFIIDASVGLLVTVDGVSGNDTLIGPNLPTAWNLTAANQGTGSTPAGDIAFNHVLNLIGGTAADTFTFQAAGSIAGTVDGGAGPDTVDVGPLASRAVTLTGLGATDGFTGVVGGPASPIGGAFLNIDGVTGSQFGATDALNALNAAASWTHTGAGGTYTDAATGRVLAYANFETLNAGAGDDTFNVRATAAALTINAGDGNDVFNLASDAPGNAGNLGALGGVLTLNAGSGADRLQLNGTAGNDQVVLHFTSPGGDGDFAGFAQPIRFTALEASNFDGRGGANSFEFQDVSNVSYGTPTNPASGIAYATTGPASGLVWVAGLYQYGAASINAGFVVNGDADGSGDTDVFLVLGTSAPGAGSAFGEAAFGDGRDIVAVSDGAVTFQSVVGGPLLGVSPGYTNGASTFSTIYVATGNERGTEGDQVSVTPSGRVNLVVDGGLPGPAARPGDRLAIQATGPATTAFSSDPALGPPQVRFTQADGAAVGSIGFEAGAPQAPGQGMIAVGSDAGPESTVQVYDRLSGALRFQVTPFPGFTSGVSVASGDVTGDGVADLLVGAGPGGGPRVAIFNGIDGALVADFFGYEAEFRGGVNVSAADINTDGFADIILGTGPGGGPRVRVLSGRDFSVIRDVFAYNSQFRGGVNVAAGDVNGDGTPDLVTSTGSGGGPQVVVLDGRNLAQIASFFVFDPNSRDGFYATVGDTDGDGFGDIIVGSGPGGPARVRVFSGVNRAVLADFFVNDPFDGGGIPQVPFDVGVRVAAADVNGDRIQDVVTGKGPGSTPTLRVYQIGGVNPQTNALFTTLQEIRHQDVFDAGYGFGIFVGASD